jgi:hypothetical protein
MWLMTGALHPVDEIFRALSHPKYDVVYNWFIRRAGLRALSWP